jgi:uncharacterized membrane protein
MKRFRESRLFAWLAEWLPGLLPALVLRTWQIGATEFWYDEGVTALLLRLPLVRMIAATAGDTHPPLYYLLLWPVVRLFGESHLALRLPSVLLSVAAIPVAYYTLKALGVQDRLARWVTIWMIVSPFQIYFAGEARMYAALQLLVLCAVWAIAGRRWLWVGASVLLLLWLHNYGVIYAALLFALALWREERLSGPLMAAFALPGLAWLPWLYALLLQMSIVSGGYWIEPPSLGGVIYTLTIMLFGPFARQYVLAGVLALGGWCAWLLWFGWQRRHELPGWVLQAAWLVTAPFLISILISIIWKPVYLFRGLIGAAPFLYCLALWPLEALRGWRRLYALAIAAPLLLAGLLGYLLDVDGFKSTTVETLERMRAEWQPGDIVYATNDGQYVMTQVYAPDLPLALMPQCIEEHDRGALSALTREALGVQQIPLGMIDHRRTWLLLNYSAVTSECNVRNALALTRQAKPWLTLIDTDINHSMIYLLNDGYIGPSAP